MPNFLFFIVDICAAICFYLVGLYKYRSAANAVTLFSVVWALILAGSNLGLHGYYPPSNEVNLLILSSITIYAIAMVCTNSNDSKISIPISKIQGIDCLAYKPIMIIGALSLVFVIPLIGNAINIILNEGGWTALRLENYAGESSYRSTIQIYGYEYISIPVSRATVIIGAIAYFSKAKNGGKILILGCVESLLCAVVSAGRGPILNIVMLLLWTILVVCTRTELKHLLKKIVKPKVLLTLLVILVLILVMTSSRHAENATLGSTIYQYYFTGPSYLTQLLGQTNSEWVINKNFMFGWATFGFLINIPLTFGLMLGLGTYTSNYWIGSVLTSGNLQIGDGLYSNAMCTIFYDFLLDWGYMGILIGPIILSLMTLIITKRAQQTLNIFWVSVVILWIFTLFRTTFKWDLVDITFLITVFFLFLFTKCANRNNPATMEVQKCPNL